MLSQPRLVPSFIKAARIVVCALILLISGHSLAAQFTASGLLQMDDHFKQIATALVNQQAAAGYVILISEHGKIVHEAAVGFSDRAKQIPMNIQTRFRIASMTKPIVAAVVMQLVDEHKIALDDPIQKYLPEYSNPQIYDADDGARGWIAHPATRVITVRQLLSHSSGLGYAIGADPKSPFGQAFYQLNVPIDQSLACFSQRLGRLPLYFEPGQGWRYSYSFDVLGRLIEVITQQNLEQALQERIFIPLNMHHTTFHVSDAEKDTLAVVYRHTASGALEPSPLPLLAMAVTANAWESGGGGLVSNAEDYWHFASMLLADGLFNDKQILSKSSVRQMLSVQVDTAAYQRYWGISAAGQSYGLGLGLVIDQKSVPWPTENGEFSWGGALDTHWLAIPHREIVAILLAQNDPTSNLQPQMTDVDFHRYLYAALKHH